jgi:DNA-binding transcriptional ArsR family regulator
MDLPERADGSWTLLTGHGHVLVEIACNTRARIGDIAAAAGLTERTVQAIIADLEAAGYITRTRAGRRTVYTVLLRHYCASQLYANGIDLAAIQEVLGHSWVFMTMAFLSFADRAGRGGWSGSSCPGRPPP